MSVMTTPTITRQLPIQIALRLPEDLLDALNLLTITERMPRNTLIVRMLDAAVKANPEALAEARAEAARQSA